MHGTISCERQWDVMADLNFYRDPEETEKEEQAAAEKAASGRNFTVNRPLRLLSSLLLDLRRQAGLQACRCRWCLFGSSLLQPGVRSLLKTAVQLPSLRPLKTRVQPLSSLKLFFHKLLKWRFSGQKMESFLKKKKKKESALQCSGPRFDPWSWN